MKKKKKVKIIIHITRMGKRIAVLFFCLPLLLLSNVYSLAEWSIVTYIQADNNLESFAYHNINSMKKAATSPDVNILVQWDQPNNNKTWRYKIERNKQIDAGTLNNEMGQNPEHELVEMMRWVKNNYPAKHYMMVLWNHGNGVIDRKNHIWKTIGSWIEIPGAPVTKDMTKKNNRGILYDDSQGTFLTNQALSRALKEIHHNVLGQKLDIIGMDACLMAMLEVAYQVKDDANYFVGAQHTEPGDGWDYGGFLKPLTQKPTSYSPSALAKEIVRAYARYYRWDSECTQSAIDLSKLDKVKQGVDNVVSSLNILEKTKNSYKTKALISYAKSKVTRFYTSAYADLHCLYHCMRKKSRRIRKSSRSRFSRSLRRFESVLAKEQRNVRKAVIANAVGRRFKRARGIAIYLPRWNINSTYYDTNFAKESNWLSFIA